MAEKTEFALGDAAFLVTYPDANGEKIAQVIVVSFLDANAEFDLLSMSTRLTGAEIDIDLV